jgi:hypothetical protein
MTFDNSKTIIGLRIKLFAVTVIFLAYLILAYVAHIIKFPVFGLTETVWTFIIAIIWVFVAFLPMFLSYQFIFYSDDTEKIILRYFNAGIVGGRKNSLEIDKRTFAGYKTDSKLFGLIVSVTLYQRYAEGVAKYPAVYISALSRDQKDKLYRALNQYAQM